MSFKEIKDERLELQKYKAGFKTYEILMLINLLTAMIICYAVGIDEHPIVMLSFLPVFAGMWVFESKAQEWVEFDTEQKILKDKAQGRSLKKILRSVFVTFLFGIIMHYVVGGKSIWDSILFAILMGIGMEVFFYFERKKVLKKMNEEKEHV